MTEEQVAWIASKEQQVSERVQAYPEMLQQLVEATYVKNILQKLPHLPKMQADFVGFKAKVEMLLSTLPLAEGAKSSSFSPYITELGKFKEYIKNTYKLIPKGYYTRMWLPIGVAIGTSNGLLFKNIGIGIALGVGIGIVIGAGLDRKAEKENRVL